MLAFGTSVSLAVFDRISRRGSGSSLFVLEKLQPHVHGTFMNFETWVSVKKKQPEMRMKRREKRRLCGCANGTRLYRTASWCSVPFVVKLYHHGCGGIPSAIQVFETCILSEQPAVLRNLRSSWVFPRVSQIKSLIVCAIGV